MTGHTPTVRQEGAWLAVGVCIHLQSSLQTGVGRYLQGQDDYNFRAQTFIIQRSEPTRAKVRVRVDIPEVIMVCLFFYFISTT